MAFTTRVEAGIRPTPGTTYTDVTFRGAAFEVTVAGDRVTAVPLPGVVIDPDAAGTVLEQEVSPYLAVLSAELQRPIELVSPVPSFRDDPSGPEKRRPVGSALVQSFIIEGASYESDFATRLGWAQSDAVYRDLCDLLAAAAGSPNPRPDAFKMVERLETRFQGRQNALGKLGLSAPDINVIVADQSAYRGDRHAEYPVGAEPARLDAETRGRVIAAASLLRRKYEEKILGASLAS